MKVLSGYRESVISSNKEYFHLKIAAAKHSFAHQNPDLEKKDIVITNIFLISSTKKYFNKYTNTVFFE